MPSSLLARARRAASKNGAILVGDERSGRFSHELVKGEYRMVGQKVGHHNGEALAAALARRGGPLEGTPQVVTILGVSQPLLVTFCLPFFDSLYRVDQHHDIQGEVISDPES